MHRSLLPNEGHGHGAPATHAGASQSVPDRRTRGTGDAPGPRATGRWVRETALPPARSARRTADGWMDMINAVLGSLTKHAAERMLERHVSCEDANAAMQCGQMYHRGGAVTYFMGRREAQAFTTDHRMQERLNGVTVVCDSGTQTVCTTYRDHTACRRLRRRRDYRRGR